VNAVAPSTVRLASFTRADFPRLLAWAVSPEFLMQWAGPLFRWPLDEAQLEAYLAPTHLDPPPRIIWRAEDLSGVPVGHLELNMIDRDHRSAVLARVLVEPARRGQGFGRAMIAPALDVAFGDLRLHRVELRVFDFNVSALRCYDSLGFVREGVWRDASRVGGTYWNIICCSLLENEWRRRQTP